MTTKRTLLAALLASGLVLTACSSEDSKNSNGSNGSNNSPNQSAQADASHEHDHAHDHEGDSKQEEVAGPQPRLVATYDGGILTLDAETLEVINDTKLDGFNRLNQLGDGRTVLVSTKDGFQIFDAGAWTEPHGDHTHSYTVTPSLKDHTYEAVKPGHVVVHEGRALLFGDGDGSIQDISLSDVKRANKRMGFAKPEKTTKVHPHHGVAVALPDGGMLHTEGTEDERHTVVAVDKDGKETARTEDCPGVHGEAPAAGAITVGCQDGIVIFKNGAFQKVKSKDSYGRIGNQAGSDESPVVLGDYKVDKDAELERPTRVTLTNTETGELKIVDVEASYSFRSLGRGPEGEALVLGTDGNLRKIDPKTGEITGKYKVTEEWKEPEKWQKERPTLFVLGDVAYVSEPQSKKLHAVDIKSGKIIKTVETPEALNEVNGVEG
ncbi:hypothetical protein F7230_06865 [Corynebacterium sp. 320]|uniref:hypothetical protein n=1 Tax=Corynebacterium TaxID=1716 RepID=UPI00125CAEAA|nr:MULTISPECIES: hypothetical protein [Corynebacterium]KAB1502732.1 hypothetical protein F7230_06865 [Corynebacterium sp. 320]KAB1550530.1 hypothetical protein F7232_09645 [Corynebacterium sp. 319]KAB1554742.1 hypothetical protein F7233_00180 [Corynebacterium sp. 321]KAB3526395.1 hypothetical protein F8354_06865 [Corynebacterium sp. 250]KAB3537760.1 hypothetical protein F8390_09615 [Corynebacterium sp. 366]